MHSVPALQLEAAGSTRCVLNRERERGPQLGLQKSNETHKVCLDRAMQHRYISRQLLPETLASSEASLGEEGAMATSTPVSDLQPHKLLDETHATLCLDTSLDGNYIASGHGDHTVKVFECDTGRLIRELPGHPRTVWCVRFHPSNSNILASCCWGGEIRVWAVEGAREMVDGRGCVTRVAAPTHSIAYAPPPEPASQAGHTFRDKNRSARTRLFASNASGHPTSHPAAAAAACLAILRFEKEVVSIDFSPCGNYLCICISNCLRMWKWRDAQPQQTPSQSQSPSQGHSPKENPDNDEACDTSAPSHSHSHSCTHNAWSDTIGDQVALGLSPHIIKHTRGIRHARFTPDGKYLLVAAPDFRQATNAVSDSRLQSLANIGRGPGDWWIDEGTQRRTSWFRHAVHGVRAPASCASSAAASSSSSSSFSPPPAGPADGRAYKDEVEGQAQKEVCESSHLTGREQAEGNSTSSSSSSCLRIASAGSALASGQPVHFLDELSGSGAPKMSVLGRLFPAVGEYTEAFKSACRLYVVPVRSWLTADTGAISAATANVPGVSQTALLPAPVRGSFAAGTKRGAQKTLYSPHLDSYHTLVPQIMIYATGGFDISPCGRHLLCCAVLHDTAKPAADGAYAAAASALPSLPSLSPVVTARAYPRLRGDGEMPSLVLPPTPIPPSSAQTVPRRATDDNAGLGSPDAGEYLRSRMERLRLLIHSSPHGDAAAGGAASAPAPQFSTPQKTSNNPPPEGMQAQIQLPPLPFAAGVGVGVVASEQGSMFITPQKGSAAQSAGAGVDPTSLDTSREVSDRAGESTASTTTTPVFARALERSPDLSDIRRMSRSAVPDDPLLAPHQHQHQYHQLELLDPFHSSAMLGSTGSAGSIGVTSSALSAARSPFTGHYVCHIDISFLHTSERAAMEALNGSYRVTQVPHGLEATSSGASYELQVPPGAAAAVAAVAAHSAGNAAADEELHDPLLIACRRVALAQASRLTCLRYAPTDGCVLLAYKKSEANQRAAAVRSLPAVSGLVTPVSALNLSESMACEVMRTSRGDTCTRVHSSDAGLSQDIVVRNVQGRDLQSWVPIVAIDDDDPVINSAVWHRLPGRGIFYAGSRGTTKYLHSSFPGHEC